MNKLKNLFMIVEGKSESIFMRRILSNYLYNQTNGKIILHVIQNETSSGYYGGVVNYQKLINNIKLQLRLHPQNYVTTFIDFYGLSTIDFPFYAQIINHAKDPYEEVKQMENILANDVGEKRRFIPYIQLHEFEALYFADYERFLAINNGWTRRQQQKIIKIVEKYPNPELINNSFDTVPSRLLYNILRYNKVRDTDLYQKIVRGKSNQVINHMRYKCPHFNSWLKKLFTIVR